MGIRSGSASSVVASIADVLIVLQFRDHFFECLHFGELFTPLQTEAGKKQGAEDCEFLVLAERTKSGSTGLVTPTHKGVEADDEANKIFVPLHVCFWASQHFVGDFCLVGG